jgi:hypothetical protein
MTAFQEDDIVTTDFTTDHFLPPRFVVLFAGGYLVGPRNPRLTLRVVAIDPTTRAHPED